MQVAEITGMLKGEDAPATVFFPSVGAGCHGEETLDLSGGIGFANDIVVRGDAHTSFYRLEKNIQVLSLGPQAFQFQVERRPAAPTDTQIAAPQRRNPTTITSTILWRAQPEEHYRALRPRNNFAMSNCIDCAGGHEPLQDAFNDFEELYWGGEPKGKGS